MKRKFFYPSIAALLLAYNVPGFTKTPDNNLLAPLFNSPGNWFVSFGAGAQHPQWHSIM